MGRNKYSQHEVDIIAKLLKLKCEGTRFQQKQVRHQLRVNFEFNISDFNVQGQAFGPQELQECVRTGKIKILDDATIAAMKEKRARDKERDRLAQLAETGAGEEADWKKAQEEWEAWERENAGKTE